MAHIDHRKKKLQAKIVYYGPGLCGKTTNLEYISQNIATDQEMMSLATDGDRTIFFDFFHLDLGKIRGLDTSFKMYTVPGQVRYNQTRKMVLKNVDGVVFVADSQTEMLDANLESWDNLFANLEELGIKPEDVSLVMQYNKRDLPDVLPKEELDRELNPHGLPAFMASAIKGDGVVETLKAICKAVFARLNADLGGAPATAEQTAAAARVTSAPSRKAEDEDSVPHPVPAGRTQQLHAVPPPAAKVITPPPTPPSSPPAAPQGPSSVEEVTRPVVPPGRRGSRKADTIRGLGKRADAPSKSDAGSGAVAAGATGDASRSDKVIASVASGGSWPKGDEKVAEIASALAEQKSKIEALASEREKAEKSITAKLDSVAEITGEMKKSLEAVTKVAHAASDLKSYVSGRLDRLESMLKQREASGKAEAGRGTEMVFKLNALREEMKKRFDDVAGSQRGLKNEIDALRKAKEEPSAARKEPAAKQADQITKGDLEALRKEVAKLREQRAQAAAPQPQEGLEEIKGALATLAKRFDRELAGLRASLDEAVAELRESAAAAARAPAVAEREEKAEAAEEEKAEAAEGEKAEAAEEEKAEAAEEEKAEAAEEEKAEAEEEKAEAAEEEKAEAAEEEKAEAAEEEKAEAAEEEKAEAAEEEKAEAAEEEKAEAAEEEKAEAAEEEKAEAAEEEKAEAAEEEKAEAAEEEKVDEEPKAAAKPAEEPKENPFANDPRHKNAARIARVMVADLLLYHKQEVEEGIKNDDFFERNKEALDDMRTTYDSRLDEEVRKQWDYLEPAIQKLLRDKRAELGIE